MVKIRIN